MTRLTPKDREFDLIANKTAVPLLAIEALVLVTTTIADRLRNTESQIREDDLDVPGFRFGCMNYKKWKRMNRTQLKRWGPRSGGPEVYCVQILHLEDSPYDAALILDLLEDGELKCAVTHALNRMEFEAALKKHRFDVILCDQKVPGYSGFEALDFAQLNQPDVPVIILSGALDDEQAVQSLKHGATDYVLKERLARLVPAILRALDEADDRIIKAAALDRIREQASLLNLTRDAILVRNMNDQITYWNPGAESVFGFSAEEAVGRDFVGLLQGDSARLGGAKEILVQTGDWLGEIQLKGKSGEDITVMSRWNLVRGKDGQPQSILSTNTDVTEMRKLETVALRGATDGLQKSVGVGQRS